MLIFMGKYIYYQQVKSKLYMIELDENGVTIRAKRVAKTEPNNNIYLIEISFKDSKKNTIKINWSNKKIS